MMINSIYDHAKFLHDDNEGKGIVVIGMKRNNEWKQIALPIKKIGEEVSQFEGLENIYISQNRFRSNVRRIENLQQLNALYCDIEALLGMEYANQEGNG